MKLTQLKETYEQEMHTCGPEKEGDWPPAFYLRTESPDGNGNYVVLNVTEWAFDNEAEVDAFAAKIKQFMAKAKPTPCAAHQSS